MSDSQQIERDLRDYLNKEPNLSQNDKIIYLRAIFDKHFTLTKLDHLVPHFDFVNIIGDAKNVYSNQRLSMSISRKSLSSNEMVNLAILESMIGYLNKNDLLKKLPKFDYTD